VRAAYVYNVIKFVEWPQSQSELLIGYFGTADTGDVIRALLNGRIAAGRTIRVLPSPSEQDFARCSVLYIGEAARIAPGRLPLRNVLTIGETDAFARAGGMVSLVQVDDHIQLDVNVDAARAAGIEISSHLLSIAQIVHSPGGARN
jgi:YfiR/HmsC-like